MQAAYIAESRYTAFPARIEYTSRMYGLDESIRVDHKEITENNEATRSVTNSIAGLARYKGDIKKAVKKTALLPNLHGN